MALTEVETHLARKAIRGDRQALMQLIQSRSDYLYRTAYLYVGNQNDALDVIQEATTQAVLGVTKLRNPELFFTWFTRILIRQAQAIYMLREHEEVRSEPDATSTSTKEASPERTSETHLDLLAAFQQLRAEYRQVMQLFYYQDLPIHEISNVLNLPEATIKTRLRRGRIALKDALGGDYCD